MRKWTSLLLALAMTLSLAACGNSGTQENTSEPPASVSGSTGEETPAPTGTETPAEEPSEEPAESETSTTGDSSSVLVPFNTSASGGFGRSPSGLEESAPGASILDGISLTERTLGNAQSEVTTWLDELGL